MTRSIDLDVAGRLLVYSPHDDRDACLRIPDRKAWDPRQACWVAVSSRVNMEYLAKAFPDAVWSLPARERQARVADAALPQAPQSIDDYHFAEPPPWAHQRQEFARSRGAAAWALLMEPRTGKTRVVIDTFSDAFLTSRIDLAVVVCPNSVKATWESEILLRTPPTLRAEVLVYAAGNRRAVSQRLMEPRRPGTLLWLIVNCDLLSSVQGFLWLQEELRHWRAACAVDEATAFKNPRARRTKHLLRLRSQFVLRRILTGTLVTQGPLDVFAPFAFLDPAILGFQTYVAFRREFAVMGGWNDKVVVAYVNEEKLADLVAAHSSRVTRDQCFDIPPKLYLKREVELSDEQRRLYDQMADDMFAVLPDASTISATIALTQLARFQQIVGGFVPPREAPEDWPPDDPRRPALAEPLAIPGPNPKLEALLDLLETEPGKVTIWARYRPEIACIVDALITRYGPAAVAEFHGGVPLVRRNEVQQQFARDAAPGPLRFLVAQDATGGKGLDFSAARLVVYFSNSFSLENRIQTEDRAQHGDKTTRTDYVDLIARNTVDDKKILPSLRAKKHFADVINRDEFRAWI